MSKQKNKIQYSTPESSFVYIKQDLLGDTSVCTEQHSVASYPQQANISMTIPNRKPSCFAKLKEVLSGFSLFKINFTNSSRMLLDKREVVTSSVRKDTFYAPSDVIRKPITIVIKHINLRCERGIENSEYVFEIVCDKTWLVRKTLAELETIMKKTYRGETTEYHTRNHEIKTTIQVGSDKVTADQLQLFIVTGVVKNYSVKSNYIFIKENEWCATRIKIVGKAIALYKKDTLRYVFNLNEADVFPLTESNDGLHCFVLSVQNKNNVFACLTENEKNEWVRYLRKMIFTV